MPTADTEGPDDLKAKGNPTTNPHRDLSDATPSDPSLAIRDSVYKSNRLLPRIAEEVEKIRLAEEARALAAAEQHSVNPLAWLDVRMRVCEPACVHSMCVRACLRALVRSMCVRGACLMCVHDH